MFSVLHSNEHKKSFVEPYKIKAIEDIKVCIDPDWMPFEKLENGKHIGMSADYLSVIENKIGIPLKVVDTKTWSESIEYAKSRKCDIFSLAMETPERKEYMNFTRPYLSVPLVIATTHDKLFINDISEVLNQKMGIVKGYAYAELLKIKYPDINLIEVENIDDGLKQVASEKLFGFIGNLTTVGYKLQKSYIGTLKITGRISQNWELGIGVRNDSLELLHMLDDAIALIDTETKQKILNKWMSVTFEKSVDYSFIFEVLGLIFIAIVFLLYRYFLTYKYNQDMQRYIDIISKNVLTSSTDVSGNIIKCSDALCELTGYSKEELIGHNNRIFRHPSTPEEVFKEMWKTISNGKKWEGEIQNCKKDGSSFWVYKSITPIIKNGTIVSYNAISQNITDRKIAQQLSITDPLTKISNRLHLEDVFKDEVLRAKRYQTVFSVIIMDVDLFKNVNDTYGHDVGDQVLISIANILRENIRNIDVVGRWGGEEFLIICPETKLEHAKLLARKLRDKIARTKFKHVDSQTCSFGVSSHKDSNETSNEVVKRADDALYEAKNSGRNSVVVK